MNPCLRQLGIVLTLLLAVAVAVPAPAAPAAKQGAARPRALARPARLHAHDVPPPGNGSLGNVIGPGISVQRGSVDGGNGSEYAVGAGVSVEKLTVGGGGSTDSSLFVVSPGVSVNKVTVGGGGSSESSLFIVSPGVSVEKLTTAGGGTDSSLFVLSPGVSVQRVAVGGYILTTTITGGPAEGAAACDSSATFTFAASSTDPSPSFVFVYRVDGGPWQGPIKETSVTLGPLSDGSHTFEVAAIDELGNEDPNPAKRTFMVDTQPPSILHLTAVPTITGATVTWTTDKPATSQVEYQAQGTTDWIKSPLDSGLVTTHSVTLSGLTPATVYAYRARSADSCGQETVSAPLAFTTVQDTPPTTTITSGPADGATVCDNSATFTFSGSDAYTPVAALLYEYRLDGAAWSTPSVATTATFLGLADGVHTFEVAAINASGEVDPHPAKHTFTVDAAPPVLSALTVNAQALTSAIVTWTTDKPATSSVAYRVQGTVTWSSSSPDTTLSTAHRVTLTGLQAGLTYEYQAHSTDACGHETVSAIQTFSTVADTTPPTTTITAGPTEGGSVCALPVVFSWTGADNVTPTDQLTYSWQLDAGGWSPFAAATTQTFATLAEGAHVFQVRARDAGGNIDPNPAIRHFAVSTSVPVITAVTVASRDYRATVTWTTDKPATSQVEYGLASDYGSSTVLDPALVTAHAVTVTGLTPLTAYHFRVKSSDGCHETDSNDGSFTTTDILRPDLEVTSLTFPATVKAHDQISVSWTVQNNGPGDTTTSWNDAVYLSPTATLDPNTATLLGTYSTGLALAMGSSYTQTQTISLPGLSVGGYYLIVAADSDNTVAEADETNNALAMPITFMKVQTFISTPDQIPLTLHVGVPVPVVLTLGNLGDAALTGITAAVTGSPTNVSVQVAAPDHLDPTSSQPATVTVLASDASKPQGNATVTLTTAEGQQSVVTLNLTVVPPAPNLIVSSNVLTNGALAVGMLRGQQTLVQATLSNTGDTPATGLVVSIPNAPWLALSTPASIGDLAPGQSASIVLSLMPDSALPLGPYTGTIAVNGTNTATTINFDFNCISSGVGSLKVTSSDEFSYFATPPQPLTGAALTLTDPQTGATILTGTTDENGVFTQGNVPEGNYTLTVTSPDHQTYINGVQIAASRESDIAAFLSRQFVTYQWTVVPFSVPGQYNIQLQAVFSANVPAPVVTVSPLQIDLTTLEYDSNGQATVYLTITNHGLVAANDTALSIPDDPDYKVTTPTSQLGQLAPLSTIVVPVVITSVTLAPHAFKKPVGRPGSNDAAGGPVCSIPLKYLYDYICLDKITVERFVSLAKPCFNPFIGTTPPPPPDKQDPSKNDGQGSKGSLNPTGGGPTQYNFCDPCNRVRLEAIDDYFSAKALQEQAKALMECTGEAKFIKDLPTIKKEILKAIADGKGASSVQAANDGRSASEAYKACKGSMEASLDFIGKIVFACQITQINKLLDALKAQQANLQAQTDYFQLFLGDPKWASLSVVQDDATEPLVDAYGSASDLNSDGGPIVTDAERGAILALPLPTGITTADVNEVLDRWNRTLTYYGQGILYASQVPSGQSTDFITIDQLDSTTTAALAAANENMADGYTGILDGPDAAVQALKDDLLNPQSAGICATVKINLDQTVAITRTAFKATLQLSNAPQSTDLSSIKINLQVTDAAGNDATSLFGVGTPTLTGFGGALDGTGTLPTGNSGTAQWTLLPTHEAAATGNTVYYVGGQISYMQNGTQIIIPIFPTGITVVPDPYLQFHYFLQKQVYADDPFTPQVEPSEPFSLGLLVDNIGLGTAHNFTLTSAQPQIVDNEKGLLEQFKLIGTQVNTQTVSPSLKVGFGDLAGNSTAVAQFLLTSSLTGTFTGYSASFTDVDDLFNGRTSLIDSVDIHSLEHVVRVVDPADDSRPDFLSIEAPSTDLPNDIWNSDGTTASVTALTDASVDEQVTSSNLVIHLTEPTSSSGFVYIRLADPGQGNYALASVVRSDGKVILLGPNAWTTSRLIHLQGQAPYQQARLYLFDKDSTGSYTITYAQKDPVDQPLGSLKALPDGSLVTFGAAAGTGGGGGGSTGGGAGGSGGLSGPVVVTAAFPDALYLEAADRSAGIKAVLGAGQAAPQVGDLVSGAGAVRTGTDGERYLDLSALSVAGSGPLAPLEITTKGFFGADSIGYDAGTGAGQKGMAGGAGLDPVGLLAATLGRVTAAGGGALTLDDGYGRPVKVLLPAGVPAPAVGAFVAAVGPVSLERHPDGLYPVLRLRNAADLAVDLSGLQGGFLSPTDTLLVGDNLFSLPGLPASPAPPSVLSGIDPGDGSALLGRLTRYDAPTQGEVFWDGAGVAGPFGDFLLGEGYRLSLHPGESGQIGFGGFRTDFADLWVSLPVLGATRIGTPFPVPVDWSQVLVTDGTKTVPLRDAAQTQFPPWLSSRAQYFDAATQTNRTLGLPEDGPDSTALIPWRGYYVFGMKDQMALILPAHAGLPAALALSPSAAPAGGGAFTLTVTGANFTSGAVVHWNGAARPTVWVSPTALTAAIPASDLAVPGTASVTVVVPGPYGGESAPPLPFTVTAPPAVLLSLTVPSPVPGGTVVTATVTLAAPAFSDTVVGLSSSDSSVVRVFRAVVVPAGSTSAPFSINTYRSHVTKSVTIRASLNSVVLMAPLTITGR